MRTSRGYALAAALIVTLGLASVASPANAAVKKPKPRLTVGDVRVAEGDAGAITVQVPISLDMPTARKLPVKWTVSGGTATAGVDFVAPVNGANAGTLVLKAGATEAFVPVTILGDTVPEPDETVNIDVVAGAGAVVTRSHGTLTIQDDDVVTASAIRLMAAATPHLAAATAPRLALGTPVVWEGDSGVRHAAVPITLSEPAPAPITVTFETDGSTPSLISDSCNDLNRATVPQLTSTVTFAVGEQSKSAMVSIVGNTSVNQAVRNIADNISVISGTATVVSPTADVVIMDDDSNGAPTAPPVGTSRISEPRSTIDPTFPPSVANTSNGCGYPSSSRASISGDGRFVAFSSNADNLVGDDTNGYADVFVKDAWTGVVTRLSVASDGTQANGDSMAESISADGRFVAFSSLASNLVPNNGGMLVKSFLYDRSTGTLQRLSGPGGPSQDSRGASISADGRYVAFSAPMSCAAGSCTEVYVLDRTTNVTSLVSSGTGGPLPWAYNAAISGDGTHVAFIGPGASASDVYEKDLSTGSLTSVSVNNAGQEATGVYGTYPSPPALSFDGQKVAFTGEYCNMGLPSTVCHDGSNVYIQQVWVRDLTANTTTLGSVSTSGAAASWQTDTYSPSLSANGRYLTFATDDVTFAPECPQSGPTAGGLHEYQRDLSTGITIRVDKISKVKVCPQSSWAASNEAMSADGNFVTYTAMVGPSDVSAANPEAVYVTRLR